MGDFEGRGGREGGIITVLNVLPVDQPCIQKVTCGSTNGLSPIVLRAHHLLLVEEGYQCEVVL